MIFCHVVGSVIDVRRFLVCLHSYCKDKQKNIHMRMHAPDYFFCCMEKIFSDKSGLLLKTVIIILYLCTSL